MEQNLPFSHDHSRDPIHMGDLSLLGFCWVSFWIPGGLCSAEVSKRAEGTGRFLGRTDRGTHVHEGLVEWTCVTLRDQGFGKGPEKPFCL